LLGIHDTVADDCNLLPIYYTRYHNTLICHCESMTCRDRFQPQIWMSGLCALRELTDSRFISMRAQSLVFNIAFSREAVLDPGRKRLMGSPNSGKRASCSDDTRFLHAVLRIIPQDYLLT